MCIDIINIGKGFAIDVHITHTNHNRTQGTARCNGICEFIIQPIIG